MPLLALLLYLAGLALAFGVRTFVHWRRTGDTGLRADAGAAGSTGWWAKLLFLAALVLGLAGPTAALAGLAPLPILDHAAVGVTGLVVAAAGVTTTLLAQLSMGDSWRVGVGPGERTNLVTGGAFALVRNPVFTAMAMTSTGLALMIPNVVSLAATAVLVSSVHLQVRAVEEPYLADTHGAAYTDYPSKVGRFLPGLGTIRARQISAGGRRPASPFRPSQSPEMCKGDRP